MAKQTAFGRLLDELRAPAHDYRPSTDVFPDLDVTRVAKDLSLDTLGTDRGKRGEPSPSSGTLDEIESQIVERVEAEKKKSHGILEDELQTYEQRLAGLNFDDNFSAIKEASLACIGDFRAEVAKGLNELHGLRRRLKEHETERETFRRNHDLHRAPRIHSGGMLFLKSAVLVALLLLETTFNGVFLAKGSAQGLLGGTTEAFAFAVLNVVFAFALGRIGVVEINHRSSFRKLLGLIALGAYFAFAVAINLALAHYREVAGTLQDSGGEEVLRRLISTPLALKDINSWVFFGIGITCSAIAFIDGIVWSDPYPGYAGLETRVREVRSDYVRRMEELIEELSDIREDYREKTGELVRVLAVRRGEYDSILSGRSRLVHLFDQHQAHLERAGNAFLSIYREANSRAREGGAPKRFSKPLVLEKFVPSIRQPDQERASIIQAVTASQQVLSEQSQAMHNEFDIAIAKYRQLDDLVPEASDVTKA